MSRPPRSARTVVKLSHEWTVRKGGKQRDEKWGVVGMKKRLEEGEVEEEKT